MKITADLSSGRLIWPDHDMPISGKVRSLRDGTREASEVVYSIPDKLPYDPHPFPKGLWKITGLDWQKEKLFDFRTYGPVKILTNAWQMVNVWELDAEGDYLRETDLQVRDTCYWLHASSFVTTLGCIRLGGNILAVDFANMLADVLGKEEVLLEVA